MGGVHTPIHWRDPIVSTPDTLSGKPRIKGTRIPVSLLLGYLAAERTIDEIIAEFPDLKATQIKEQSTVMKLKIIIHEAEEGGYWAEIPSIEGCATEGDTFEELLENIYEAIEGCLSIDVM